MRRVKVLDLKGRIIREYNSVEEASIGEGKSIQTINRCMRGQTKKTQDGLRYIAGEYISKPRTRKTEKIVELDMDMNYVRTYNNQKEVSEAKNVSYAMVNHYMNKRCKPKGYYLMWEKEYNDLYGERKATIEESKEIIKPTREEYYVNVLVGLANQTLVDGATYEINNTRMVYSKEKDSLLVGDKVIYTRAGMYSKVKVELPLLKEEERIFLKNLLKAFKNVKGIQKAHSTDGREFIRILAEDEMDNIALPYYKQGEYYGNLEFDRLYSIEELELR